MYGSEVSDTSTVATCAEAVRVTLAAMTNGRRFFRGDMQGFMRFGEEVEGMTGVGQGVVSSETRPPCYQGCNPFGLKWPALERATMGRTGWLQRLSSWGMSGRARRASRGGDTDAHV